MDDSYISLRREKIQKARESFNSTGNSVAKDTKVTQADHSQEDSISFTKVKFFIAILLFASFMILQVTKTEIKGIGSQDIRTYIETNIQAETLIEKVESLISNNF